MVSKKNTELEQPRSIGRWVGYKVTFPVAIIFLLIYLLVLLLINHPSVDNRAVALLAFSPFLVVGATLLGIRKRLYVIGGALVVDLSLLSITLKSWRYPLSDFTKIEVRVTSANDWGGASAISYGSTDVYDVRLFGRKKTDLRIDMFCPLAGGRKPKYLRKTVSFSRGLSALTGLRVEFDQSVREDIKKWGEG